MDSEVKLCRSLPPLVEGKIHGYLKLTVDEIVWSRRSPGDVAVLASWWGELDSAQFRPVDIKTGMTRLENDTVETYTIRTNVNLFEEYLKNCETIELVVVSEKIHQVIGTAHVTELLDIFEAKSYSRYFPILNNSGNRIGDIHVAIKLLNMARLGKTTTKVQQLQKQQLEDKVLFPFMDSKLNYDQKDFKKVDKAMLCYTENNPLAIKNAKHNENIYKSVLKDKRIRFEDPLKKFNMEVTDKLVAQVVARAQRLRGAILKETRNEDPLALSESSTLESLQSDTSVENEAKLYEYFLGKKMSQLDERKALETLRSMSPTPSLIDLASETIQSCQHNNVEEFMENKDSVTKSNHIMEEILSKESVYSKPEESSPLDLVDSLKIVIESLTLTSAGYRRVRSSCLSRGDGVPISVTYFVQYDTMFTSIKKTNKKSKNENRPTKLCSKKQVGQVIYFNHQAIYDIPKSYVHMDIPLKFKIFNRHLNQRTPTELGVGSMYISDVSRTEYLSTTQKLAIVNKGIKIGELKITVEFGCDRIHFGKHFVDAVTSTKENIPVYEVSSSISAGTDRYKTVTGTESKSNSRVSSASTKRVEYTNGENSVSVNSRNNLPEQRKQNTEDRTIGVGTPEESSKDKVLLHGLIYIAEGKELSQSSTYLICRAFWREDRAASRLCSNTENPFYHFHQLVPILHGPDLLERTKDNCIVTEVYSRSSAGVDTLLGIAKLPVHQLYVAYRDPLVLPHLLLSKYPVISVDGWVPITDPVTGQLCGQLLALVALGTVDQIALLEMTRGLRDCTVTPRVIHNYTRGGHTNHSHGTQDTVQNVRQTAQQCSAQFTRENSYYTLQDPITVERASNVQNVKCQECQTDITTVKDFKFSNVSNERVQNDEALQSQSSVLHVLVDRLAQVLNVPKSAGANQTAETQTVGPNGVKSTDTIEQLCLNPSRSNSLSEDSSNSSPRDNFHMPTEMYRSVGVGAEFDETTNQGPSVSYGITMSDSTTVPQRRVNNQMDSDVSNDDDSSSFRAVVEIECALHLPKMEKPDGAIEPSTFVTFQKVQNGSGGQFGSYMITNVCLNSCNPKWEWRCDTRLSTELLVNDEKRMILKIWRLADPDVSTKVDLEKDIVIGFSAIDLSVLSAGFPLVSGWFHIMDFTGKCNGQIKVSITPLESVPSFGKSISTTSMMKIPLVPDSTRSHWSPSFPQDVAHNSVAPSNNTTNSVQHDTDELMTSQGHLDNDPMPEMGLGFGDTSMSFLSLSLKQKLTELDEITKRLQSRLHDVTNAAFDDDFDNDFDPNEPDAELENNENGNVDNRSSTNHVFRATENSETLPVPTSHSSNSIATIHDNRKSCFFNEIQTQSAPHIFSGSSATTDTGYSTSSNIWLGQNVSNACHEVQNQNENRFTSNNSPDNNAEHPIRGTKMHINHLLDKLFTATPSPPTNSVVRRNIVDFITSLRHNNNNVENDGKCNQEINVRTVPTQTDNEDVQNIEISQNQVSSLSSVNLEPHNETNANESNDVLEEACLGGKLQKRSRVSALIRDELVAEENNDTLECDDLSAQLITSNVRHMDLDSIFNPLLYQHLIPDVQNLNAIPEGEAVEQLDNRYAETFNATVNNGLSRLRSLVEIDASLTGDSDSQGRSQRNLLETSENTDIFRLTPSGLSESIDGNIDVTVIHKPSNDDLMASNSTESTSTISFDKSSVRHTEKMDDTSSLTSSLESVSTVSRQAPDGGNPVEETSKLVVVSHRSDSQDSSSDS